MKVLLSILLLVSMGMLFVLNAQAGEIASIARISSKIKLNKTELALKEGGTKQLCLKNAKKKVVWSSSKKSVASVTANGVVKARKRGTCIIQAKSAGKSYQCTVTVCGNKKEYKYYQLQKTKVSNKNKKRIIVAGSSAIRRWEDASNVFAPYEVLNMGIGGTTAKQWLKWYKKLIVDYHPSAVVLFPGVRNELRKSRSVKTTTEHVRKLLKALNEELPGVPIYYMSVYCNCKQKENWPLEKRCNEKIKEYCRELKNVHYVDVTHALMKNDAPKPGVISKDGVHMSKEGYAIWDDVIVPIVMHALKQEDK